MQKVFWLSSPWWSNMPVVSPGLLTSDTTYEQFVQPLVSSMMVPKPPRGPSVTGGGPTLDIAGVMLPGADPLQLVMLKDQAPESISSWSMVNWTVRVVSIGVQQVAGPLNSWIQRLLTSVQLLMRILQSEFE